MNDGNMNKLAFALNNALAKHEEKPAMYYLKEGDPEIVAECQNVFKYLRETAIADCANFFHSEEAIPVHSRFEMIKRHIDQIKHFYQAKEPSLIQVFMEKLLPANPMPLRFAILSSISLFCTRVYIHDASLKPAPVQAYIDGYFNFVINLNENVIRIPLLKDTKDGQTPPPATLPPSIRFIGTNENEESKKRISDYVTNIAPKNGRRTQFHTFISILNSGKPILDFLPSFEEALVSFDMSFATAICALASDHAHLLCIRHLINILASRSMFDHFMRCIACSIRLAVGGFPACDNAELIALFNMFVAESDLWASQIRITGGLPQLVATVCQDIHKRKMNSTALYILRAILVIACYEDPIGNGSIAMFLEIVCRPFAHGYDLIEDFTEAKQALIRNDPNVSQLRSLIEKTILDVMKMDIQFSYSEQITESQLFEIYNFVTQKLDSFVRLVISLNQRRKSENPVIQTMIFAFQKNANLGVY